MKIVGRGKLDAFCRLHADARKPLQNWLAEAEDATWKTPQQIKDRYASVSFLQDKIVIFNVKGNTYRLAATVAYSAGVVVIEWIGTQREYDNLKWNR